MSKKSVVALGLTLLLVIIDQVIKIWVKTHFYYGEEYQITEWFRIFFIENKGMAFGMQIFPKVVLTSFRIVMSIVFVYYIVKLGRQIKAVPAWGYFVCIAMIVAGTIGNTIDCTLYGVLFDNPPYPLKATLCPDGGGYASVLNGSVVDMFYFPLAEWDWPGWMPFVGGEHFLFFQPIFNFADANLCVGVFLLLVFYYKYISSSLSEHEPEKTEESEN